MKKKKILSISNMVYHQLMISKGMSDIFEIGKLHREENSSGKTKLSEFTSLDISKGFCKVEDICRSFEQLIVELWLVAFQKIDLFNQNIIDDVRFDTIGTKNFWKSQGKKVLKDLNYQKMPKLFTK